MFVYGSGRNEQFYREPYIDVSYQASVHWTKGFQSRRLKCEVYRRRTDQLMAIAHVAFGKVCSKALMNTRVTTQILT
jgi:hypothetical protein